MALTVVIGLPPANPTLVLSMPTVLTLDTLIVAVRMDTQDMLGATLAALIRIVISFVTMRTIVPICTILLMPVLRRWTQMEMAWVMHVIHAPMIPRMLASLTHLE